MALPSDGPVARWEVIVGVEPISVNRAYSTGQHGRRFLTAAGEAFKAQITEAVAQALPFNWGMVVEELYRRPCYVKLVLGIYQADFDTKSWKPGARQKKDKTKFVSPYKRSDGPNFEKLVSDAIATATGIDDHFHLDVRILRGRSGLPGSSTPGFLSLDYEVLPYVE